jgi:UDP-N-acetylmuramate dehydrogenase
MIEESTMEALGQVEGLTVRKGESLAKHSLWRVGGPVEVWLVGETEAGVEGAFAAAGGHSIRVPSSRHFLVRDGGIDGIWMSLGAVAHGVQATEGTIDVGAEHPAAALAAWARSRGLGGVDALATRAGSVGEAFSAGLLDGLVDDLRVIRAGSAKTLAPERVLEAHVLLRIRLVLPESGSQPADWSDPTGRPGQALLDPPRGQAAELVQDAGLCGVRLRGARIGTFDANCLSNLGGATARDVFLLLSMMRDRVKAQCGLTLDTALKAQGRG